MYLDFVSKFQIFLFGEDTSWKLLEVVVFMKGRGVMEKMEDYDVIMVFCSTEKPIFLPYYVYDKLFFIEIALKYRF